MCRRSGRSRRPTHVKAALDLLQKADRPIFVAGGGVRASGAGAELVALAEALQIPVATSLNGKDCIPGTHPLSVGVAGTYSRESANRAVNRADLVCFIGSETGGMTTHFWAVPKIGTPAIQIDIEPESLGRNYRLQASVLGDAKAVLSPCSSRPTGECAKARALDQGNRRAVRRVGRQIQAAARLRQRTDSSGAHLPRADASTCPTTPSWWSTPATPACGWAAYTICAVPRRATSVAPAISVGRFPQASAPRRRVRTVRSWFLPATPASGITSPRSRPRCAGSSMR